ncbi:MAG TPA: flagellin [Candidatus Sulfotelmatobacter sp.]|nr:flagellin [Candidatus Sulfotelmatobacter sp.]
MDVLGFANYALNANAQTQSDLSTQVQRLSSGLRINTAADDPSGLAIATSLATKVMGLDQGVQEVQDANNALTIADGAMATISDILQRMRSLVVQANSDLESTQDQADIQVELTQLTLEINKISENTTYNGRNLLDGSASSDFPLPNQLLFSSNPTLASGQTLYDPTQTNVTNSTDTSEEIEQTFTVNSYDPTTDMLSVTVDLESASPGFGPAQVTNFLVQAGTNVLIDPAFGPIPGPYTQTDENGQEVLQFAFNNLSAADVGQSATVVSLAPQTKAPGSNLYVNDGSAEGSTIAVDIPAVTANNLGVGNIVVGSDTMNTAAEYRIDYGIQYLGNIRARVGAQNVSLQEAAVNANTASVNYQASESAIRDLNVAQATTAFTKDQIQVQIQQRIIAGVETMAQSFATLVSDAIVV